jgi:hypothetical protein
VAAAGGTPGKLGARLARSQFTYNSGGAPPPHREAMSLPRFAFGERASCERSAKEARKKRAPNFFRRASRIGRSSGCFGVPSWCR